jgi:uncharacterized protein
LGNRGVDEIRFNTAATGYDDQTVSLRIRQAAQYIGRITVEIPAIPEDIQKVKQSLKPWAEAGVGHLNLHELMVEPGTNSWLMDGPRQEIQLADGHFLAVHPHSREMILELIHQVQREEISLAVNHCSLPNKINQVHRRRINLLPLTQAPYEKWTPGDLLESYCLYDRAGLLLRCHPDQFSDLRRRYPKLNWARMARTAPLGVHDQGQWVLFEAGGPDG